MEEAATGSQDRWRRSQGHEVFDAGPKVSEDDAAVEDVRILSVDKVVLEKIVLETSGSREVLLTKSETSRKVSDLKKRFLSKSKAAQEKSSAGKAVDPEVGENPGARTKIKFGNGVTFERKLPNSPTKTAVSRDQKNEKAANFNENRISPIKLTKSSSIGSLVKGARFSKAVTLRSKKVPPKVPDKPGIKKEDEKGEGGDEEPGKKVEEVNQSKEDPKELEEVPKEQKNAEEEKIEDVGRSHHDEEGKGAVIPYDKKTEDELISDTESRPKCPGKVVDIKTEALDRLEKSQSEIERLQRNLQTKINASTAETYKSKLPVLQNSPIKARDLDLHEDFTRNSFDKEFLEKHNFDKKLRIEEKRLLETDLDYASDLERSEVSRGNEKSKYSERVSEVENRWSGEFLDVHLEANSSESSKSSYIEELGSISSHESIVEESGKRLIDRIRRRSEEKSEEASRQSLEEVLEDTVSTVDSDSCLEDRIKAIDEDIEEAEDRSLDTLGENASQDSTLKESSVKTWQTGDSSTLEGNENEEHVDGKAEYVDADGKVEVENKTEVGSNLSAGVQVERCQADDDPGTEQREKLGRNPEVFQDPEGSKRPQEDSAGKDKESSKRPDFEDRSESSGRNSNRDGYANLIKAFAMEAGCSKPPKDEKKRKGLRRLLPGLFSPKDSRKDYKREQKERKRRDERHFSQYQQNGNYTRSPDSMNLNEDIKRNVKLDTSLNSSLIEERLNEIKQELFPEQGIITSTPDHFLQSDRSLIRDTRSPRTCPADSSINSITPEDKWIDQNIISGSPDLRKFKQRRGDERKCNIERKHSLQEHVQPRFLRNHGPSGRISAPPGERFLIRPRAVHPMDRPLPAIPQKVEFANYENQENLDNYPGENVSRTIQEYRQEQYVQENQNYNDGNRLYENGNDLEKIETNRNYSSDSGFNLTPVSAQVKITRQLIVNQNQRAPLVGRSPKYSPSSSQKSGDYADSSYTPNSSQKSEFSPGSSKSGEYYLNSPRTSPSDSLNDRRDQIYENNQESQRMPYPVSPKIHVQNKADRIYDETPSTKGVPTEVYQDQFYESKSPCPERAKIEIFQDPSCQDAHQDKNLAEKTKSAESCQDTSPRQDKSSSVDKSSPSHRNVNQHGGNNLGQDVAHIQRGSPNIPLSSNLAKLRANVENVDDGSRSSPSNVSSVSQSPKNPNCLSHPEGSAETGSPMKGSRVMSPTRLKNATSSMAVNAGENSSPGHPPAYGVISERSNDDDRSKGTCPSICCMDSGPKNSALQSPRVLSPTKLKRVTSPLTILPPNGSPMDHSTARGGTSKVESINEVSRVPCPNTSYVGSSPRHANCPENIVKTGTPVHSPRVMSPARLKRVTSPLTIVPPENFPTGHSTTCGRVLQSVPIPADESRPMSPANRSDKPKDGSNTNCDQLRGPVSLPNSAGKIRTPSHVSVASRISQPSDQILIASPKREIYDRSLGSEIGCPDSPVPMADSPSQVLGSRQSLKQTVAERLEFGKSPGIVSEDSGIKNTPELDQGYDGQSVQKVLPNEASTVSPGISVCSSSTTSTDIPVYAQRQNPRRSSTPVGMAVRSGSMERAEMLGPIKQDRNAPHCQLHPTCHAPQDLESKTHGMCENQNNCGLQRNHEMDRYTRHLPRHESMCADGRGQRPPGHPTSQQLDPGTQPQECPSPRSQTIYSPRQLNFHDGQIYVTRNSAQQEPIYGQRQHSDQGICQRSSDSIYGHHPSRQTSPSKRQTMQHLEAFYWQQKALDAQRKSMTSPTNPNSQTEVIVDLPEVREAMYWQQLKKLDEEQQRRIYEQNLAEERGDPIYARRKVQGPPVSLNVANAQRHGSSPSLTQPNVVAVPGNVDQLYWRGKLPSSKQNPTGKPPIMGQKGQNQPVLVVRPQPAIQEPIRDQNQPDRQDPVPRAKSVSPHFVRGDEPRRSLGPHRKPIDQDDGGFLSGRDKNTVAALRKSETPPIYEEYQGTERKPPPAPIFKRGSLISNSSSSVDYGTIGTKRVSFSNQTSSLEVGIWPTKHGMAPEPPTRRNKPEAGLREGEGGFSQPETADNQNNSNTNVYGNLPVGGGSTFGRPGEIQGTKSATETPEYDADRPLPPPPRESSWMLRRSTSLRDQTRPGPGIEGEFVRVKGSVNPRKWNAFSESESGSEAGEVQRIFRRKHGESFLKNCFDKQLNIYRIVATEACSKCISMLSK
ncbi:uncharacterized protein LOC105702208 [Orussus abietinus]|uniref:uncharacterized protein LOC105702208 n=1 Tax=Orussus abietinus TaxID=222816 RepID=UPI000625C866|nr:uncharacterized protein LOC105702208 [Orussus abietinus]